MRQVGRTWFKRPDDQQDRYKRSIGHLINIATHPAFKSYFDKKLTASDLRFLVSCGGFSRLSPKQTYVCKEILFKAGLQPNRDLPVELRELRRKLTLAKVIH